MDNYKCIKYPRQLKPQSQKNIITVVFLTTDFPVDSQSEISPDKFAVKSKQICTKIKFEEQRSSVNTNLSVPLDLLPNTSRHQPPTAQFLLDDPKPIGLRSFPMRMASPETIPRCTFTLEHQLFPGLKNILVGTIAGQQEPDPSVCHRTTLGANASGELFLIQQICLKICFQIRHFLRYSCVGVKGHHLCVFRL